MKNRGIRISDTKDGKCIPFLEILENIKDGNELNWAALWLDVTPQKNEGHYIIDLEKKINESENGLFFSFEDLKKLSVKFFQEIELTVIGSRLRENLHRYKEDRNMYEMCDVVIEMIDGGFWEVFSSNRNLISQLNKQFQNTEMLISDLS